jgi:competence protein ComK
MIEYITNNQYGSIMYTINQSKQLKKTSLSIIKRLCMESFFTYEGYLKSIKKYYPISYKIPIFINESMQFIQTKRARDDDNIWINFAAIINIKVIDQGVILEFMSGSKLFINISDHYIKSQIHYLEQIRKRKVNIFITNNIEKV